MGTSQPNWGSSSVDVPSSQVSLSCIKLTIKTKQCLVCMPRWHWSSYYSSVAYFKIRHYNTSSIALLLRVTLALWGPCASMWISLFFSNSANYWDFDGNFIKSAKITFSNVAIFTLLIPLIHVIPSYVFSNFFLQFSLEKSFTHIG